MLCRRHRDHARLCHDTPQTKVASYCITAIHPLKRRPCPCGLSLLFQFPSCSCLITFLVTFFFSQPPLRGLCCDHVEMKVSPASTTTQSLPSFEDIVASPLVTSILLSITPTMYKKSLHFNPVAVSKRDDAKSRLSGLFTGSKAIVSSDIFPSLLLTDHRLDFLCHVLITFSFLLYDRRMNNTG